MQNRLKIFTISAFIVTMIIEVLGRFFHFYYTLPWLDLVGHFSGGVFLSLLAIYSIARFNAFQFNMITCVFVNGFVLIVAVLLEIGQFFYNFLFPYRVNNLLDTASDILVALIGGLVVYFTLYFLEKEND